MSDAARHRVVPRAGLALLLIAVGALSFIRGAGLFHENGPRFDFSHFFREAEFVWTHGELNPEPAQRHLPFYLPVVPLLLSPLGALGFVPAAGVWALIQIAALAYGLRVLARWCQAVGSPPGPAATIAIIVAIALPAIYEATKFNQLSFLVLALLLGALTALERKRPALGGALLALAVVLKLLPIVFALWLILKRKWKALGAFVVTAVLLTAAPCLLVYGAPQTLRYHREWLQHNTSQALNHGMLEPDAAEHFSDRRNQSLAAVGARLFWPGHPHPVAWQPLALSESACRWGARSAALVLLAALLWVTRRPSSQLGLRALRTEAALYTLAMLVLSPLLRQYYLVWALPALVELARCAAGTGASRSQLLGRAGLIVWLAGMLAWLSPLARAYGAHLIVLTALGVLLVLANGLRPTARCEQGWRATV